MATDQRGVREEALRRGWLGQVRLGRGAREDDVAAHAARVGDGTDLDVPVMGDDDLPRQREPHALPRLGGPCPGQQAGARARRILARIDEAQHLVGVLPVHLDVDAARAGAATFTRGALVERAHQVEHRVHDELDELALAARDEVARGAPHPEIDPVAAQDRAEQRQGVVDDAAQIEPLQRAPGADGDEQAGRALPHVTRGVRGALGERGDLLAVRVTHGHAPAHPPDELLLIDQRVLDGGHRGLHLSGEASGEQPERGQPRRSGVAVLGEAPLGPPERELRCQQVAHDLDRRELRGAEVARRGGDHQHPVDLLLHDDRARHRVQPPRGGERRLDPSVPRRGDHDAIGDEAARVRRLLRDEPGCLDEREPLERGPDLGR